MPQPTALPILLFTARLTPFLHSTNEQDMNGMLSAENFRGCLIIQGFDVTPDTPQVHPRQRVVFEQAFLLVSTNKKNPLGFAMDFVLRGSGQKCTFTSLHASYRPTALLSETGSNRL